MDDFATYAKVFQNPVYIYIHTYCRSVIIPLEGGKLHIHAPISAFTFLFGSKNPTKCVY